MALQLKKQGFKEISMKAATNANRVDYVNVGFNGNGTNGVEYRIPIRRILYWCLYLYQNRRYHAVRNPAIRSTNELYHQSAYANPVFVIKKARLQTSFYKD